MDEEKQNLDLEQELDNLSHEDLCEITQSSLRRLIAADPLLQDLPGDVTTEEVVSQIAVAQGKSITVVVLRHFETPLSVVIPQIGTTVRDLKRAIQRNFTLRQQRVVACTNWKRILMVLTGVTSATNVVDIPGSVAHAENSTLKLSQLRNDTIANCVNTYTTFIMVRHPFERLLSAYRNKFETTYTQYFRVRYGKDIIRKYRKNATKTDLETGRNVSFREFVLYILDGGAAANEHWAPIYDLCQPCSLNYTFIGRYETLGEDSRALLDMIGAPSLTFPYTKPSNTAYKLKRYFQQLSMSDIQRLYKQYEYDFKLFGYNLEDLLGFDLP
ncbi:Carbohydrate sulfotransferase 11-like Protein [Tribolium castaneum]|uniref:Carbohydrate sulfotransferase n=1 Tax=Tribolium castaneum TaxID=7070 RepID=A0A139WG87_TRICA|nr:Carbohydrate sulfotransferase 11-like Protein [Tribolium castaneum]